MKEEKLLEELEKDPNLKKLYKVMSSGNIPDRVLLVFKHVSMLFEKSFEGLYNLKFEGDEYIDIKNIDFLSNEFYIKNKAENNEWIELIYEICFKKSDVYGSFEYCEYKFKKDLKETKRTIECKIKTMIFDGKKEEFLNSSLCKSIADVNLFELTMKHDQGFYGKVKVKLDQISLNHDLYVEVSDIIKEITGVK